MGRLITGKQLPIFLEEGDTFFIKDTGQVYKGPVGGGTPEIAGLLNDNLSTSPVTTYSSVKIEQELFDREPNQVYGSNYTLIRSLSDLPSPNMNGEIILSDNHIYEFAGIIDIGTNTIIMGANTMLFSKGVNVNGILHNNPTGVAIVINNLNAMINGLRILLNGGTGVEILGTNNQTYSKFISLNISGAVVGIKQLGTYGSLQLFDSSFDCQEDIFIQGNLSNLTLSNVTFGFTPKPLASNGGIRVTNGGSLGDIKLFHCTFSYSVGCALNIPLEQVSTEISLIGCTFTNISTPFIGFTSSDIPKVKTLDNQGILNMYDIPNLVNVRVIEDFPAPVGGIITLQDNKTYRICNSINLGTLKIQTGVSNTIYGSNKKHDALIYTGDSNFITCIDHSLNIHHLSLSNPTPGSRLFNFSNTAQTEKIEISDCIFSNCQNIAFISGFEFLTFHNNVFENINSGIDLGSATKKFFMINNKVDTITSAGNAILTVPSGYTGQIMEICDNYFNTGIGSALAIENTTNLSIGKLYNNTFTNSSLAIVGTTPLDKGNIAWNFSKNIGIENSSFFGFYASLNNTIDTTISSNQVYYRARLPAIPNITASERMDVTSTTNRYISIDNQQRLVQITATGTIFCTSNNKNILIALFKNQTGAQTTSTQNMLTEVEIRCITANQPFSFALQAITDFNPGDYVELWVRNLSNTSKVRVVDFQILITAQL